MTDKPILSQSEKNQFKYLVDCTEIWLDPIYEEIESLIRAHVCKALDGIELPSVYKPFVENEQQRIGFGIGMTEAKSAIQKAKEAYL